MFPSPKEQRRTARQGKQHNRKLRVPYRPNQHINWLKTAIAGLPVFDHDAPEEDTQR